MEGYTGEFFVNSGFGGCVHAASCRYSGEIVAIKTVEKSARQKANIQRETTCARSLNHPGIIRTFDIIETDKKVHYIQEYAEGGDLFDHVQTYGCFEDESLVKLVFGQMVAAVKYMHHMGFCHRDLKPENVVLMEINSMDGPVAKLIDFGLAEESRYVQGRVGTDAYAAPEVARIEQGGFVDGYAADIWSLGIVLVFLLCGMVPWAVANANDDAEFAAFMNRRLNGCPAAVFNAPIDSMGITPHLSNLLNSMLCPDPAMRPSIVDVEDVLSKPWIRKTAAVDRKDMYTYRMQSTGDSGFSWGDLSPDDEVDFSTLPVPSFEPMTGGKAAPVKADSGLSFH